MIHLHLLGAAAVEHADVAAGAAAGRRRSLALLAFVAAAAPLPVSREKLLAHLWPESDTDRARNSLRQMLFWLRRELGEDVFLPESAGGLQLNAERVSADLWTFRRALERGALATAVDAWGGPFLDGFHISGLAEFGQWVEAERAALARDYLRALEVLAQQAEAAHRHDEAVAWRRRQAAADPWSSRVALALLRALVAADDRPGALQFASVYQALVREQLEADPDPAVVAFVEEVRRASVPRGAAATNVALTRVDGGPPHHIALHAPSVPQPQGGARAVATPRRSRWRTGGARARLTLAAALIALGAVTSTAMLVAHVGTAGSEAATVVILGSGARTEDARDAGARLVACDGPACPAGALPQAAFVVSRHPFYETPVAGTGFISPVPDGTTTREPTGYPCCTTAVFEHTFALPPEAVSATISLSVLADNHAAVIINGVGFGQQPDSSASVNYAGPRETFTTTFVPAPDGQNTLRIRLWNGGGAVAVQYSGVVTWVSSVADSDGDGVPDDIDAFLHSDRRPTVHVGRCATPLHNLTPGAPRGATFNDLLAQATAGAAADEGARRVVALAAEWRERGLIQDSDVAHITACTTDRPASRP